MQVLGEEFFTNPQLCITAYGVLVTCVVTLNLNTSPSSSSWSFTVAIDRVE